MRAIALDLNLILSGLNDFGESIRFIGTSNRPVGTLFGPRNRAGSYASFTTPIKHLRRATSGAAGNGLDATMKYLRRTTSAATNNGLSTMIIPPSSAASFEVNSEPHTGARPSVRLCVGPELARCAHTLYLQRK
jgi:hypothetical protein